MGKETHLASGTVILLLISFANMCLVCMAALSRDDQSEPRSQELPRGTKLFGSVALGMALSSQILYLVFSAAWLFQWTKFYPGNPIQRFVTFGGLTLSAGAFVTALLGTGLKRFVGVLSSLATVGLWFLSAIASVAV